MKQEAAVIISKDSGEQPPDIDWIPMGNLKRNWENNGKLMIHTTKNIRKILLSLDDFVVNKLHLCTYFDTSYKTEKVGAWKKIEYLVAVSHNCS